MTRRWRLVAAAAVGPLLAGCIGSIDRAEFEDVVRSRGGGVTAEQTLDGLDALRAAVDTDDVEALHLSITPANRFIVAEVRDPRQREHVDRHVVRGGSVDDPEPVRTSVDDLLEAETFRISQLTLLAELDDVAAEAIAALGFADDGYVTSIYVSGSNRPLEVRFSVESPRAAGTVSFTADGELIEAVRS